MSNDNFTMLGILKIDFVFVNWKEGAGMCLRDGARRDLNANTTFNDCQNLGMIWMERLNWLAAPDEKISSLHILRDLTTESY